MHSCCLHYPSVLAFSSKDKNSWHSSSQDLIAEAHFTLSKPGLIHPGAPADRNPLSSPPCCCLCFLFFLILKRKKNLDKKWAGGEGKMLLFLSLIFLSKALRQCFPHYYYAKMFPKSVSFFFCVCVCFPLTVSGSRVIPCINQPTCLLLVWTTNLNSCIKTHRSKRDYRVTGRQGHINSIHCRFINLK